MELGNGQWDIPELHALLGEVLAERENVQDFRVLTVTSTPALLLPPAKYALRRKGTVDAKTRAKMA